MSRDAAKVRDEQLLGRLQQLADTTNNEFGNSLVFLEGSSSRWNDSEVIPTGSLSLDMAIGIGGWPRGRVIEIFGEYSSGKTTLALHSVREAQMMGIPVMYIDAENALDPRYMRKLGVDPEAILINQPSSLQNAIDLIKHVCASAPDIGDDGMLIVLDSIPALAPMEVLDTDAEQQFIGLAARYWSNHLPGIVQSLRKNNVTLIMINQVRATMNMYTPAADSTPGGKALKFNYSIRAQVKRQVDGKGDAEGSKGQTTSVKIVKNKVGSPFREASYYLPSGLPIDYDEEAVDVGIEYGIVWADTKIEDGEEIDKNGWFTYKFRPGDLDAIREDEREGWAESGNNPENFESEFHDDDFGISVYRLGPMKGKLAEYPRLIDRIREHVLEVLNEGDEIIDPDSEDEIARDEQD